MVRKSRLRFPLFMDQVKALFTKNFCYSGKLESKLGFGVFSLGLALQFLADSTLINLVGKLHSTDDRFGQDQEGDKDGTADPETTEEPV